MKKYEDFIAEDQPDKDMQDILCALKDIPQIPVPPQFDLNLRRALKEEAKKKKNRFYKKIAAAAAAVAIGAASFVAVQDGISLMPSELAQEDQKLQKESLEEQYSQQDQGAAKAAAEALPDSRKIEEASSAKAGQQMKETQQSAFQNQDGSQTKPTAEANHNLQEEKALSDGDGLQTQLSAGSPHKESNNSMESGSADSNFRTASMDTDESAYLRMRQGGITEYGSDLFSQNALNMANAFAAAVSKGDIAALTDMSIGSTEQSAETAMRCYKDLFQGQELTVTEISHRGEPGLSAVYMIGGNGASIQITVTQQKDRMVVREPVLDLAEWLAQSMSQGNYRLQKYDISSSDDSVTFYMTEKAEDAQQGEIQVRSIRWMKAE